MDCRLWYSTWMGLVSERGCMPVERAGWVPAKLMRMCSGRPPEIPHLP